ncbi:flagellar motor switch protein FliG [Novosphingobium mangrovi (ex Huang et al. 2023)]|uniref:Flagellar motor switch protein FliG n=1 Tax=Novosphingobium mangrovi (ex Huang et al. 2023) TaxID=2976432 RepID=A0ABT2I037_9SPHN|nr:flagellar motor switch protein FliG [Novosphingobium mangrovi (ex Huang et al. 2023)]MCT2398170.1 flagellar motor switch protein FliG [Novosphingobium mangrovi (ex Huang et al. 2023)]
MSEIVPLRAADNAAVMMMLLGEDQTAGILSELEPEELRMLGEKMCALGEISPDVIAQAIAGFVEKTEKLGLVAHNRVGQVRTMMTRAIGELKTENMMRRIVPEAPAKNSTLELARWLTPEALVPLVKDEHPQTVAVLLVQLDPEVAAEVLHSLPKEAQSEIIHRIATLGPVSPPALEMLEELLNRRIAEAHGQRPLQMGGTREAADIINGADKATEKRIMSELNKLDRPLAKRIEEEMFKFEHLFVLDPMAMGTLLREVPSDTLIDALKGIGEEEREFFFRAMSSRAADGVKDEIAARGRTKLADVVSAQKEIVMIARKLAAEGSIAFGSSDDDYV